MKSFLIKENAASEQEAEDTKSLESSEQMDQVGNSDLSWSEKPTSRGRKNRLLEVDKTDFLRSEKPTYRSRENRLAEVGK